MDRWQDWYGKRKRISGEPDKRCSSTTIFMTVVSEGPLLLHDHAAGDQRCTILTTEHEPPCCCSRQSSFKPSS